MAKAKAKTEAPVQEKPRSPLSAFFHHQKTALEETGKAVASLLPKDFREHGGKALDEGRAGFKALYNGLVDSLECGLDKLRSAPGAEAGPDEDAKAKVKVEVE